MSVKAIFVCDFCKKEVAAQTSTTPHASREHLEALPFEVKYRVFNSDYMELKSAELCSSVCAIGFIQGLSSKKGG